MVGLRLCGFRSIRSRTRCRCSTALMHLLPCPFCRSLRYHESDWKSTKVVLVEGIPVRLPSQMCPQVQVPVGLEGCHIYDVHHMLSSEMLGHNAKL